MNDLKIMVLKSEGKRQFGLKARNQPGLREFWERQSHRCAGSSQVDMSLSRVPSEFHEMETLKDTLPFEQRKFRHHQEGMSVLTTHGTQKSLWAPGQSPRSFQSHNLGSDLSCSRHQTVFVGSLLSGAETGRQRRLVNSHHSCLSISLTNQMYV